MDTCFLCLPDTLSNELVNMAQSGFESGLAVGSAVMLAAGTLLIVLGIISRAAGH